MDVAKGVEVGEELGVSGLEVDVDETVVLWGRD